MVSPPQRSAEDVQRQERTSARIDEAFRRAKLGLPLSDHDRRIVQFLGHGFGCHSCATARAG